MSARAQPPRIEDIPGMSDALKALARRGEVRQYRKGTVLIQEGERGDTLFVILAGQLRAFSADARGREITYGTYGPGEYLGEMSLDGGPRSASVITVEPTSCAMLTRETLLQHIAVRPEFAMELLGKVIRRARAATLSTRQMALNDVYGRLVSLLQELAVPGQCGTATVEPAPTHQQMASRLGCSREMVSRLMKDLVQGGYVIVGSTNLRLVGRMPARW
jgi:CRP/FNR family transcriptional regulator, cyclic AMP receptor protein